MSDDEPRTYFQLMAYIMVQIDAHGSQKALAKHIGVSPAYLSDVVHGRRLPGAALLDGLGFERVVAYQPKKRKGVQP